MPAQIAILLALVSEEGLDDAELDAFLDTARTLTSQWFTGGVERADDDGNR